MANEPIDQVDFQIGGDVTPLKTQAGPQAKAVFDDIGNSGAAAAAKISAAFQKGADDIAASAAKARGSSGFGGVSDDLDKLQAKFDPVFSKQQKFAQAQGEINRLVSEGRMTQQAGSAALAEFAAGFEHVNGASRKTREGLVLVHEFIRGDFKRGVGSALIELQNFGAMGAVFNPITIGVVAATGALIAMGVAAVQADAQLSKIQRNIIMNGGGSGITQSQLAYQGGLVGQQTGISSIAGQNAIMTLNARGNIPSQLLPQAATAGTYLAEAQGASGKDATKVLDDFEKELADPAKGAKELNEQFKLLSAGQTREIDDLSATGDTYDAQRIIIEALTDRSKEAADALGGFQKALNWVTSGISDGWSRLGKLVNQDIADISGKAVGAGNTPQEAMAYWEQQRKNGLAQNDRVGNNRAQYAWQQESVAQDQYDKQRDAGEKAQAAANEDTLINRAKDLGSKWDVEGTKSEKRADAISQYTQAVIAAKNKLGKDKGKSPGLLKADQENLSEVQTGLANAQNPNYKPGSGIPKARAVKGPNSFQVDAQTAEEQLTIARQIAAAPEGQRAMLKAQLDAQLQYQKDMLNPKAAPHAATIRDTKIAEAGLGEQSKASDQLENINESTAANSRLADAYGKSTSTAKAAEIQNTALEANLKNQAVDVDKLTAALTKQAFAEAQVSSARGFSGLTTSNTALQAQLAAGGDPAAMQAARRHSEALAANQGILDAAGNDPSRPAQANGAVNQYQGALQQRDTLNRGISDNAANDNLRQQISLEQQELALKNTDVESRAKEMADIEATTQLKKEGWTVDQAGYAQALASRQQLLEQSAQLNLALQGQTKEMQLTDALKSGLEKVGMAGTKSFKDMKTAAASLLDTIGDLLIKLYVVDPLVNSAMSAMGAGSSTNPGSNLGASIATTAASSFINSAVTSTAASAPAAASAAMAASSTVASALSSMVALAGGGPLNPAGYTLVGENGPEILGPGHAGVITPMTAPNMSGIMGGGGSAPVTMNHNISIVVSGTGDKDLLNKVQSASHAVVNQSLAAYNQVTQRNSRQLSINANNRALR